MLMQNLRGRIGSRLSGNSESGFTLIELLVVMLILGILAAIAIPAFFNQKNKANDSQAKSYAHSAQVAIETYATDHNGKYNGPPAPTAATLQGIEPTLSNATLANPSNLTATNYTVTVTSSTGNQFSVSRVNGTLTFPCQIPAAGSDHGGCNIVGAGLVGTWN